MRDHRFDPAPLLALIAARQSTVSAVARAAGEDPEVVRSRLTRPLTWVQADRYAIALGVHPAEVWPDWWPDARAVAAFDRLRAALAAA